MNRKSSAFLILGILTLSATVLILGWGILRKSQLDSSSQELAINVTLAIFSDLNTTPLIEAAHESLTEQQDVDGLRMEMMNFAEMFGRLELIESIAGSTTVALLPFLGSAPTASYEITTFFTLDSTSIYIEMIFENEIWKITDYRVGLPQLDA